MSARPPGRKDKRKPRDNRPKPSPKSKVIAEDGETVAAYAYRVAASAPPPGPEVLERLRRLLPAARPARVRAA